MDYKVLKEVLLTNKVPTGKTKHIIEGSVVSSFYKLQIAQYNKDSGYYLFYLDEDDDVVTDTYHDTIEHAERQADFEFEVKPEEWDSK